LSVEKFVERKSRRSENSSVGKFIGWKIRQSKNHWSENLSVKKFVCQKICLSKNPLVKKFIEKFIGQKLCQSKIVSVKKKFVGRKQAKNAIFVFFACFRPHVGQADDHIG
jgi:hypothetical protein